MAFALREGQPQRHFDSDQSVWRDDDWNGFVRISVAGVVLRLRLRSGETPLLRYPVRDGGSAGKWGLGTDLF